MGTPDYFWGHNSCPKCNTQQLVMMQTKDLHREMSYWGPYELVEPNMFQTFEDVHGTVCKQCGEKFYNSVTVAAGHVVPFDVVPPTPTDTHQIINFLTNGLQYRADMAREQRNKIDLLCQYLFCKLGGYREWANLPDDSWAADSYRTRADELANVGLPLNIPYGQIVFDVYRYIEEKILERANGHYSITPKPSPGLELVLQIRGEDAEELQDILVMLGREISEGYISGFNSNDTSSYNYRIIGEPIEHTDDEEA